MAWDGLGYVGDGFVKKCSSECSQCDSCYGSSGNLDGFKERFTLNDKFDGDGVEATIVDGILAISVPYKESVKPRKVKVKVG